MAKCDNSYGNVWLHVMTNWQVLCHNLAMYGKPEIASQHKYVGLGSFTLPYIASCMHWQFLWQCMTACIDQPVYVHSSWEPYGNVWQAIWQCVTACIDQPVYACLGSHMAMYYKLYGTVWLHVLTGQCTYVGLGSRSSPRSHTLLPISHTAAGATQASSSSIQGVSHLTIWKKRRSTF